MDNYIITIARGFGSGGKEIGVKLGKELGIPCYEKELLDMASEYSGISKRLFSDADEKIRGKYIKKLLAKKHTDYVVSPSSKAFVSDNNLFNIQSEIIRELAKKQSCIIIGKCADHILKDMDNVISLYIEAPRKSCVESIMNKLQVSEEEAHSLIHKTDKYRKDYYKYYAGGEWTNPINYDMTLNSAKIGRDKCVEVIKQYVGIKFSEA